MKLAQKIALVISFSIAISGFLVAASTEYRVVGITIFMVGFFVACISIIATILSIPTDIFGRTTGAGIKIAATGFGIIVLSQLSGIVVGLDSRIGDAAFVLGVPVMLTGILLAVIKIAK